MSADDSIYLGFVTKGEILTYLDQYGLRTEENMKPIENLRNNQCLRSEIIEFYQQLIDNYEQQHEITIIDDTNDSIEYESENENLESEEENLDDTLAEMEAFISMGAEYELEESISTKNQQESSFCPPISSTTAETTMNAPNNSPMSDFASNFTVKTSDHSPLSDLGYFASNSNSGSSESPTVSKFNSKSNQIPETKTPLFNLLNFGPNSKSASSESPIVTKLFKNATNQTPESKTAESLKKLNLNDQSPELIFTPQKVSIARTPLRTKENINPVFKTPLLKSMRTPSRTPSFKNIVSPISRYISETPKVPLFQKVVQKSVPFLEHNPKSETKTVRTFAELPERFYRPSKIQSVTFDKRFSPLPKNLDKYISKPLRPEIIKHMGRKNVRNEFEEYYESYPLNLEVEDLSTFIDLETSRVTEMSVIVSSEAKFTSELSK